MYYSLTRVFAKLYHLVLKPIRVFSFHQIGSIYNPITCFECDWINIVDFKQKVLRLKRQGWTFISLETAYLKIQRDKIRLKKYAVLTADDGYRSQLSILSWLKDNEIPITLFLNARYLDGKSCAPYIMERARTISPGIMENEVAEDLYLTYNDLLQIQENSNVSIASHGFEHIDATKISVKEFHCQVSKNLETLQRYSSLLPFHAYTWGRHNDETDASLQSMKIVPVLMDGNPNFNCSNCLHRENLID